MKLDLVFSSQTTIHLSESIFRLIRAIRDTFLTIEVRLNHLMSKTIRGGFSYSRHYIDVYYLPVVDRILTGVIPAFPLGNVYNENESDIHSLRVFVRAHCI